MRSFLAAIVILSGFISGCAELKELHLPSMPDSTYASSQEGQLRGKKRMGYFGYYVISDSMVKSAHVDSALTVGILVPQSSYEISATERKMSFGNGIRQCRVHFAELNIQHASEIYSVLDEMLFPRSSPVNYPRQTDYTTMKRLLNGILFDSLSCDTIRFYFEQIGQDVGIDTTIINGYFRCSSDSFFVEPSFKRVDIHGKNTRDVYLLQGYSLRKGDDLIAFLLHAPNFRSGPDILYLRRDISEHLQMHLSVYFTLVSRLVEADPGSKIF